MINKTQTSFFKLSVNENRTDDIASHRFKNSLENLQVI